MCFLFEKIFGFFVFNNFFHRGAGQINAITLGKPTLEDVFVHHTGHRFWADVQDASTPGSLETKDGTA